MSLAYKERIEKGFSFLTFFALRLERLYPLHFIMLLVWLIYILSKQFVYINIGVGSAQIYDGSAINLYTFLMHTLLLNGMWTISEFVWNGPSWSISTELFAYATFFMFVKFKRITFHKLAPLVISVTAYLFLFFDLNSIQPTLQGGFIRCLAGFFLGMFVFNIRDFSAKNIVKYKNILEIFAVSAIIISVTYSQTGYVQLLCVLVMALSILVFSSSNSGHIGKALETRLATNLGKWSFSIYMVHSLVISAHEVILGVLFEITSENTTGISSMVINFSILSLTLLISRFTYELVEVPYRNNIKVFVSRR